MITGRPQRAAQPSARSAHNLNPGGAARTSRPDALEPAAATYRRPPVPCAEQLADTRSERRVLLVEDDPRVRQMLALALSDEGHDVLTASTGEQALERLEQEEVDIVLLDLMLPGIDGIEVCRRMRQSRRIPIIMVTARASSADVVRGLECGADDYVTKPVVAEELTARMTALWRRIDHQSDQLRVGPIEVNVDQASVRYDGKEIQLTRTEFRLLCELAFQVNRVVTREQLLQRVWGYDYFGDTRLLDVHVRRLRCKVEPDPGVPRHLLTVRGAGYRLVP
jgi:two-component system response regulator MtrA